MAKRYYPKYLYIENSVREEDLAKTVLKNLPSLAPQYFDREEELNLSGLSVKDGKEVLVIARKKGRFLKSCPGSARARDGPRTR